METINYNFKIINTTSELYQQVIELRYEILRKPLGLQFCKKDLICDDNEKILTVTTNDFIIGVLQFRNNERNTYKLRQMAIAKAWQHKGMGAILVQYTIEYAKKKKKEKIVLHARQTAIGFYKKLGFKTVGVSFEEVGIPHHKMELYL